MEETVAAIRELNDDPTSIFTVLTGSGRFFSAGADVRSTLSLQTPPVLSWIKQQADYLIQQVPGSTPMKNMPMRLRRS